MTFPGSPVAVISPAVLNVTSLPPYEFSSSSDKKRYPFGNRRAATAQPCVEEDYDLDLLLQQHEVRTETEDSDVDGRTESSIVLHAITPRMCHQYPDPSFSSHSSTSSPASRQHCQVGRSIALDPISFEVHSSLG